MDESQGSPTSKAAHEIERLEICPDCRDAVQTLADELHDGMIQRVIAAKMVIESQLADLSSETTSSTDHAPVDSNALHRELVSVQRWLDESLHEARSILDQLQMATQQEPISSLIERWSNRLIGRVIIDNQLPSEFDALSAGETHVVARIFQSIVGNLLQHSDGKHLRVKGERNASENIIEFHDDGTIHRNEIKHGVGLTAVERRMQSLQGHLSLSSDQNGFCVCIRWPPR